MRKQEEAIKEFYEEKHQRLGSDAWRPAEAYREFLSVLNPASEGTLLDVGCGTGFLLKEASELGLETSGVDISERALEIAVKQSPSSELKLSKGEQLPFEDQCFDYLTCLGALEHFTDIPAGLEEFVRVTKQGAKLLIVVPNKSFFFWLFRSDKGTDQKDIQEALLGRVEWERLFRDAGLRVLRVSKDDWPMRKTRVFKNLNPVGVFKRATYRYVGVSLPISLCYQFIFVLENTRTL